LSNKLLTNFLWKDDISDKAKKHYANNHIPSSFIPSPRK